MHPMALHGEIEINPNDMRIGVHLVMLLIMITKHYTLRIFLSSEEGAKVYTCK